MRAQVDYAGQAVGWLSWEPDAFGVQIEVDCAQPDDTALLRCYGETVGAPLLVGLPAPAGGRLRLRRHLSRETLKAAGCADAPPTAFYLAEAPGRREESSPSEPTPVPEPPPQTERKAQPRTGDAVLDAVLDGGEVRAERRADGLHLSCPFAPDRPFALAPAFVLCRVEDGRAWLDWTKKDAAGAAASQTEKLT